MRSLRVKLIAPFVVGTVALTLILVWYTYSSARKAVEDATLLISEAKTNHATSSMALLFRSLSSSLQNMVVDPHVTSLFSTERSRDISTRTTDWLEIITQGNEYYRDILIVDKNGICISSSNPGLVGNSYAQKEYAREALAGMFNFGEWTVGRVTKKFTVTAAAPIDAGEGVAGAFIIVNDFPKIVDYETTSSHGSDTIFTSLLTPDGMFVAHKNKELMGNAQLLFPDLYTKLSAVGEKGGTVSFFMGGEIYEGYAKVEPTTKWIILTSGVQRQVFAPAYRVGMVVLSISFLCVSVISLVIIRFANDILHALFSLINYAKSVSEGNFSLKLADTGRNDELGVLYKALQRLVQSLQSMLLETQEASKLKGQFLANMSHEIRTPLNAILGMTHLSLREPGMSEKQRGYLDKIKLAAKSLLGVINDILDISKVEAGMLEIENVPFNLRETLSNTLSIHQESAGAKALELVMEYSPDLPDHYVGDPLRIGQVLNNLISNAIKFTPAGSVTVRCRPAEPEPDAAGPQAVSPGEPEPDKQEQGESGPHDAGSDHPEPDNAKAGADPGEEQATASPRHVLIRMSVTDTGIGLNKQALQTLFQPFTQADSSISRQFGGTGLGLAISDRLVQLLGGSFSVDSELGRGTTFSFTLRLELNEEGTLHSAEEVPPEQAFEHLRLEGKRILVAEDNEINQMIIQELIAPSGATVVMADNGQKAVNAVRDHSFDLVLMDMQMPIMGGIEATLIIRTFDHARDLPIIAVTANAMVEDRTRGFASGMNGYLTKPIEPLELLNILRQWLGSPSPPAQGK